MDAVSTYHSQYSEKFWVINAFFPRFKLEIPTCRLHLYIMKQHFTHTSDVYVKDTFLTDG